MSFPRKKIFRLVFWFLLLVLLPISSICCLAKPIPTRESSCKDFVQGFYTWYMGLPGLGPDEDIALKQKAINFDPHLVQALDHYGEVAAKHPEWVEIDGDCFLNAQDWDYRRYVVDKVTVKNGVYRAYVYWVWKDGKKKGRELSVIPELVFRQGHWVFINFHYPNAEVTGDPNDENLLRQLKHCEYILEHHS